MACPLVRTALTRQSLRSRPHGFDTAKPSLSSARSHGFDTAKPSLLSARPHGFDPTKPSLSSARPHGFDPTKPSLSSARLWREPSHSHCPHGFDTTKLSFPYDTSARLGGPSKALAFPRPRHSCKVQRSPRNDSLLRTVLPLQHLTHVRPAVRARNQINTPPVNPTYRHNRGYRSTNLNRPQMPATTV